jgi:uncharacterized protein (DUF362 family)
MAAFIDRVVGVYHFLGDRIPKDIPCVEPRPCRSGPWRRQDQPVVAKVKANEEDVRVTIGKVIALLGNLEQVIGRGDLVFVKPNFNSPDPFPAATDLAFLQAALELILEAGARVTIGESTGAVWRPSRRVFNKLGVPELAQKLGVELIAFEDRPSDWVKIKIDGDYLSEVIMPRSAYEADRMVYLPCMKTHMMAGFSGAMKLALGFVAPGQRRSFHLNHLQEKLAEVSLCWQPDLIIMDGRKAFVSGGPNKGQLVEPGVLLASADLIATDVEAIRILLAYRASNKLPADPWELPQVITALRHGLGSGKGNYVVIE